MTKAPMPQSIKVGPHVYTVTRKAMRPNGECDFDGVTINVKPRLRRGKAKEILLHEVLHACTHPSLNTDKKLTDEDFVTGVSPALLQVIQDNPDLLAFLTS